MQQKLSIRVSDRITLTLESADMRELVRTGSFWSELPSQCPICQAPVQLMYRNPQDNEYFGMQCTGPTKHETNFGIHTPLAALLDLPTEVRSRMRLIHYPDLLDPDTCPIPCLREGTVLQLGPGTG